MSHNFCRIAYHYRSIWNIAGYNGAGTNYGTAAYSQSRQHHGARPYHGVVRYGDASA